MNKKKILALSVALAITGLANADTLNVYGVAHVSFDNNNNGQESQFYIASNSSRLGFNGNYVFSDQSEIFFQLESGVDLSGRGENDGNGGGQSNSLFTRARDSFVGYKDSWGNIKLGRLGILNQWLYDVNLFADQVGDLGNLWGATGIPGRADSSVAVEFSGNEVFTAMFQFVPENGNKNADIFLGKLFFSHNLLELNISAVTIGQGVGVKEHQVWAFTGNYILGESKIGFGWQNESNILGLSSNDRDTFTLGISHNLGDGSLKFQYTSSDSELANFDGTQFAIGYDYHLNSRATTYVALSRTNNDATTSFTANNYGHGSAVSPQPGGDPFSISFGLVYKFSAVISK